MLRLTCLILTLVACGDNKARPPDASHNNTHSDSGSGSGGALTLDCASYCGAIQTRCTGAVQQYASLQNCMDTCADFTAGALTDMSGNTLGCRVAHTELAADDPTTHCVHAGPSGGDTCGTTCEGFCAVAPVECPSEWTANQCATRCGGINSSPPYSTSSTGNTIECRLYHLTMAATDPTNHCPHTVAMQNPICI